MSVSKDWKKQIEQKFASSGFNKDRYSVDIPIKRMLDGLMFYTHDSNHNSIDEIFDCVPAFQRDNDKWSHAMQVRFIENIILGYRTTISLYQVSEEEGCFILDGLQRITAMHRFQSNELEVLGGKFSDYIEHNAIPFNTFGVDLFTFSSEREVVEFYIDMNEGITHSDEDILRARKYLSGI